MRPRIQAIIDQILDSVQGAGQMDVIRDVAVPLPFAVLGGILGVPLSDQSHVKEWADGLLAFQGVNKPSEAILEYSQKSLIAIKGYMTELIKEGGDSRPKIF